MNKNRAWDYCRDCDKFDNGEHPERPCLGKGFDYAITDGKPPCNQYVFDENIVKENKQ